ncbi:MAG: TIGR00725 family protein [Chloroflexi bacterium]|nr:TIGR00725 family protein [Chloroflexota bacterium]
MIIAVIGDSSCSSEEARLAETVGELLAQRGATVICGGLGGVMEAVCRGAKSTGGLTVGILPGQDVSTANPWVDIPLVTGMGEARNVVVAKSAQAVIAIGGGYGTLSEIAYALKNGIPVIGLNTWSLSRNGREDDPIIRVQSAAEAVNKAISLAKRHKVRKNDSPFSPSPSSSPIKGEEIGCALAKRRKKL